MDKTTLETVVAVMVGILLGVTAATGFWFIKSQKYNFNLSQNIAKVTTSKPTPSVTPTQFTLDISEPKDLTLTTQDSLRLKGKTQPKLMVVVSLNSDEVVLQSDSQGNFQTDLELDSGFNLVTITTVMDNQSKQLQLKLVKAEKK